MYVCMYLLPRFGRRDPHLVRPYDISASVQLSAVRYLHTMRFLKEVLAFCTHFPQLIDAFQRMKAVSRGNLVNSCSFKIFFYFLLAIHSRS